MLKGGQSAVTQHGQAAFDSKIFCDPHAHVNHCPVESPNCMYFDDNIKCASPAISCHLLPSPTISRHLQQSPAIPRYPPLSPAISCEPLPLTQSPSPLASCTAMV